MKNRWHRAFPEIVFWGWIALCIGLMWSRGPNAIPGDPRSDFEYEFSPMREFLSRWLSRGVFPFWNPQLFCGFPTIEIQQSSLFYPFNSVTMVFMPARAGMFFMLSLHILLTPVLSRFVLRRWFGVSTLGAITGAAVYSLGAVICFRYFAGHPIIVYAMTWLPVAVGAITMACDGRRPSKWIIYSAVAIACIILSGAPQYIYYIFWAQVAAIAAMGGVPWKRRVVYLGLSWCLAAALTAPQWFPFVIYLRYGARASSMYSDSTTRMSQAVSLLEFFFRYPLGNGVTETHLQRRGIWDTSGYCGVASVIVAVVGLASFKRNAPAEEQRIVRIGGAIWVCGLYLALGNWLPGFGFFREPMRGSCLMILGTSLLAARGMDVLVSGNSSAIRLRAASVCGVMMTAGLGMAAYARFHATSAAGLMIRLSEATATGHPTVMKTIADAMANPTAVTWTMLRAGMHAVAMALLCLILICWMEKKHPRLAGSLLLAVVVADLCSAHAFLFRPRVAESDTGWPEGIKREIIGKIEATKKSGEMPWRVLVPQSMSDLSQTIPDLDDIYGYEPLMPKLAFSRTVIPAPGTDPEIAKQNKAFALGLRYSIDDLDSTMPETVPQRARHFVLREVCSSATIAQLIPGVVAYDGQVEFGPLEAKHDFIRPDVQADVPSRLLLSGDSSAAPAHGTLRWLECDSPNVMQFDVAVTSPCLLLAKTTCVPGWKYYADSGRARSPIPVNGWMMAAPVDAGTRTIRFVYRPVGIWGCCLSVALASLLSLTIAVQSRRRNDFTVLPQGEGPSRAGSDLSS